MAPSDSVISAIFASTSLSPSAFPARLPPPLPSAFSSLARSFIAAFSSSVKPLDFEAGFLVDLVDLVDFAVPGIWASSGGDL